MMVLYKIMGIVLLAVGLCSGAIGASLIIRDIVMSPVYTMTIIKTDYSFNMNILVYLLTASGISTIFFGLVALKQRKGD